MRLSEDQLYQLFADNGVYDEEGNLLFDLVDEKQTYLDLEKGYRKMDFVIKDTTTGKYYQAKGIGERFDEIPERGHNPQWIEVHPYTETITKYK